MSNYIVYKLDDDSELWIETEQPVGGMRRATSEGNMVANAHQTFDQSLNNVRMAANVVRRKLGDLGADETEVEFSLKSTGEVGIFAIGKVGIEANFNVKLKWSNTYTSALDSANQGNPTTE